MCILQHVLLDWPNEEGDQPKVQHVWQENCLQKTGYKSRRKGTASEAQA